VQDFSQAQAYANALAPDGALVFRAIHDTDKSAAAINIAGTVEQAWQQLCNLNDQGYGIFAITSAMDGHGFKLPNVRYVRAHFADLDAVDAPQQLERLKSFYPAPAFAVNTSPNKYHVYWPVNPYTDNTRFEALQRRINAAFNADPSCIDPTRVMRVPGFYHRKGAPYLVTCFAMPGYGYVTDVTQLEGSLQHITPSMGGTGERHALGDESLTAPSLEWCQRALDLMDPNTLDRAAWISFSCAFKQAAWLHADPQTIFNMWSQWCAKYDKNDLGENLKQWESIRNTEIGWKSLVSKIPGLKASLSFGANGPTVAAPTAAPAVPGSSPVSMVLTPPPLDCSGPLLTDHEQRIYFAGCVFIERMGEILTPKGRFMNATKFNGTYGGKAFVIDQNAKTTNEPWAAALRSTLWTIPKVDHIRFLPQEPPGAIIEDQLGRKGINTYIPARIKSEPGDVSIFLNHMALMFPDENDRRIILEYFAHNAKYPGYKIAWAPVLQSAEGVGKGVMKKAIYKVMGAPYCYAPKAQEMIDSSSKFNAWMRNRLFILCDEIKVDERRDMIEILKPMISESEIPIEGKGVDQEIEDNPANWTFFSNWKDAIPINRNGRRFCVLYSAVQSVDDLERLGMDDDYFTRLYDWIDGDGGAYLAHWFLNYPIEKGKLPKRAPRTTSMQEALRQSRTPYEQLVLNAVEDDLPGFRGGWISTLAVAKRIREQGGKVPSTGTVGRMLEGLGYVYVGRAPRPYAAESITEKADLYARKVAPVEWFAAWQGYI